jgi:hypothetical protein
MTSVRFAETRKIHEYPKVVSDPDARWWNRHDYESFRKICKQTLFLQKQEFSLRNSIRYSARGLEHLSPEKLQVRRSRQHNAAQLVLAEQSNQLMIEEGEETDPTAAIAKIYMLYTSKSKLEARVMGLLDEELVAKEYMVVEAAKRKQLQHKSGLLRRLRRMQAKKSSQQEQIQQAPALIEEYE